VNSVKYDELIDDQIKTMTILEKTEIFNFVEFLKLKKLKENDAFLEALKEGQKIGRCLRITEKDIKKEIKAVRKTRNDKERFIIEI